MLQKKLVNFLLTIVVLLYIVFEELVWERFAQPIIAYINELKILKKLESFLQTVNSSLILVIFLIMFVFVEMLGLYAGSLLLEGHVIHGALIYAGKIPIAAFTFWLFGVTKDKLLEFGWFKTSYYFIVGMIEKITHSEIYINIKKKTASIKAYIRGTFFKEEGTMKQRVSKIYKKLKELLKV